MNNKGFAITTILYGTLILFLMLLVSMLGILSSYKERLVMLTDTNNGARDIINETECYAPEEDTEPEEDPVPNSPVVDSNMIPVVIANDGVATTRLKTDPDWYDYENKQWANIVLVKESGVNTRQYYLDNLANKVVVDQSDILAYFVWIPRYKYKIWTTAKSKKGEEQKIEIEFEGKTESFKNGTTVGSWRTHPAFWWNENDDDVMDSGELISGFWVGKFETTYYKSNNVTVLTVLPNAVASYNRTLSGKINGAKSFTDDGNRYGLDNTISDSHISLNSDWGAVAYLTHSKYGINKEVRLNNKHIQSSSGSYGVSKTTGCGASSADETLTYNCNNKYGTKTTYPQSTTGNISGVYDMAGGVIEVVMGNYNGNTGEYITSMPKKRYFNQYNFGTFDDCTVETCGGHALNETRGWYGDNATFVKSDLSWFVRGGDYSDADKSGMFYVAIVGGSSDYSGWRTSIVVGFERG